MTTQTIAVESEVYKKEQKCLKMCEGARFLKQTFVEVNCL